jgi:hypothetical protein
VRTITDEELDNLLWASYAEGRSDECESQRFEKALLEAENARLHSLLDARMEPEIEALPRHYQ